MGRPLLDCLSILPPPPDQFRPEFLHAVESPTATLFWDAPPWHRWSPMLARSVMRRVTQRGIHVAALESELGYEAEVEVDAASKRSPIPPPQPGTTVSSRTVDAARILPYRNERYGLDESDFDLAWAIDLRLTPEADKARGWAYAPERLRRWEGAGYAESVPGDPEAVMLTLPPDIRDLAHLAGKVTQLRRLSPAAKIIVSLALPWMIASLDDLIASGCDVVLVRAEGVHCQGNTWATWLGNLREQLARRHRAHPSSASESSPVPELWMRPPLVEEESLTFEDVAKLVLLGLTGVAIDGWLIEAVAQFDQIPPPSPYTADPTKQVEKRVETILVDQLDEPLSRFRALASRLTPEGSAPSLGTFDAALAKRLAVRWLGWAGS